MMRQLLDLRWGAMAATLLGTLLAAGTARATDGEAAYPDPVGDWDVLWFKVLADIVIIGVIFGVVALYWLVKYRAKSPEDRGSAPKLTKAQQWAWALVPAAIFMADDFFLAAKGWTVWNTFRRVPDNAMEIQVTGYQWFWEFEYEDGVTADVLYVPEGQPVVLRMTAVDVIHSFYMPDYRVKEDVMPGRVTYVWFMPKSNEEVWATRDVKSSDDPSTWSDGEKQIPVVCTEYCGLSHSAMFTEVVTLPPEEFDMWLAKEKAQAALDDTKTES